MRRGTLRRRILSTAVVLGAVAIAFAAPATDAQLIVVEPPIRVISHQNGTSGSGAVVLRNTGPNSFPIGSITYACNSTMTLLPADGGAPFTLAGSSDPIGSRRSIGLLCPGNLPLGMQRCTFTANDDVAFPVASFVGVCQTQGMPALTATPSTFDFGTVAIGAASPNKAIVLGNTSSLGVTTLQLQLDNDNFRIAAPCTTDTIGCDATGVGPAANGTTSVEVFCQPKTPGMHTGRLFAIGAGNGVFLSTPVTLTCNADTSTVPVLSVTPGAIAFASPIEVDGGFAQQTVELRNGGGGSLTIDSIAVNDRGVPMARLDWTFTLSGQCTAVPCTLGGGQAVDVLVRFDPSAIGVRPASLLIGHDDGTGGVAQAIVTLDGTGAGATLGIVGGTELDFGVVPLDTPRTLPLTLENTGNRETTASLAAIGPPFTFPASVVVSPGSTTDVPITCRSATPGTFVLPLSISSPDLPTPLSVALRCEVRDTQIEASPGSLMIAGEIIANTGIRHETIVVSRVGPGAEIPLSPPALVTGTPNLALAMPQTATTAMIDVAIDTRVAGAFADTIRISSPQAGIDPIDVPISGRVVTASYTTPNVSSLGTFCVGQPTSPTVLALTSTGDATLDLATAPAMAGDPSPFDVVAVNPSSYPARISPSGTASVEVTPKRGAIPGEVSDELVWRTTQASDQRTTVTATFIDDGGAIAPAMLSFGQVPIRLVEPNAMQVTLRNCAGADLELEAPTVPAPFALEGEAPTTLPAGGSVTFAVAFRPTAVGVFEGAFVVRSVAGDEYMVALIGEGIADGGDGDGGSLRDGFYSCGGCASHDPPEPLGVLAIALAMVCALRARRPRA